MLIKSKKWIEREKLKEWRAICLRRDNFECQVCHKKPNHPHVHHIIPFQFADYRYDAMNGIVLCFNCHKVGKHSPHQHALWFYEWLKVNKLPQFIYLENAVNLG